MGGRQRPVEGAERLQETGTRALAEPAPQALDLGADHAVDYRSPGWAEEIADGTVTGPRSTSLPPAEAARALTLLERGENIG
ncbi:MAG: hypothetical protein ABW000_16390 [Actinoplanes sp.]